jgi:hypothetical protein
MNGPIWSRLLYRVSRGFSALDAGQRIVRDELLFAFLAPSQRSSLIFDAYGLSRHYVAGGEYFAAGLWDWEAALLEDPRVPRAGRVLLGAAGGGRELRVLLERGFEVYAFEPVSSLLESAQSIAQGPRSRVIQATYEDLVARAVGKSGPLDSLAGAVDLCILGWGSLSHLTEPSTVLETLRALRVLAPGAPVMTSFLLRVNEYPEVEGGARRLRQGLRRALEFAGRPAVPPGLKFHVALGFIYEFSRDELFELCAQAGYEVARFVEEPYGHALLLPLEPVARKD